MSVIFSILSKNIIYLYTFTLFFSFHSVLWHVGKNNDTWVLQKHCVRINAKSSFFRHKFMKIYWTAKTLTNKQKNECSNKLFKMWIILSSYETTRDREYSAGDVWRISACCEKYKNRCHLSWLSWTFDWML